MHNNIRTVTQHNKHSHTSLAPPEFEVHVDHICKIATIGFALKYNHHKLSNYPQKYIKK